ncbi:hypothetical protein MMC20_007886 [Loxospora ochrophaea]|nr:hypothetical protein [Loxospora ochrophaea]
MYSFTRALSSLVPFLLYVAPITASPLSLTFAPIPLPISTIYEFPLGTWVENLAIRSNGLILATIFSTPELYQIDPSTSSATLLASFPGVTGLRGIAELEPDVFYVAGGNFSFANLTITPGSGAVWRVNLGNLYTTNLLPASAVTLVANFPSSYVLNGMTALPPSTSSGLLLVADSYAGLVYRLNVRTGAISTALSGSLFAAPANVTGPNGVNGIKIHEHHLYFTNTDQNSLNRVPISANGSATGPAEVVAANITSPDDFILDTRGDVFVALDGANELAFLKRSGGKSLFASDVILDGSLNSTVLAGPTACVFSRDGQILYVSSSGGEGEYVTGNFTVAGRVSRVDIGGLGDAYR